MRWRAFKLDLWTESTDSMKEYELKEKLVNETWMRFMSNHWKKQMYINNGCKIIKRNVP